MRQGINGLRSVRFAAFLAVVVSVWTCAALAVSRTKQPAAVAFHGVGPGGFKIEGKTGDLQLTEDDKTLTVIVPLKNLTTGISLRDRHMKDKYLQVDKYPDVRLVVPKAALKMPAAAGNGGGDAKGTVTLHGKSKELPFKYKTSCNAAGLCNATGSFGLNMHDFGIVIPVYLGVTMKPDVNIDVSFQAQR